MVDIYIYDLYKYEYNLYMENYRNTNRNNYGYIYEYHRNSVVNYLYMYTIPMVFKPTNITGGGTTLHEI